MNLQQYSSQLGFFGFRRTAVANFGQGNAQLLRDRSHCFRESNVLDLLDKRKHVARNSAAKAVKELPRGMDGKRRRLLPMKRTKPGKVLRPRLAQLDVLAHNADDVRLLLDRICEIARVGHEEAIAVRRNCELESR